MSVPPSTLPFNIAMARLLLTMPERAERVAKRAALNLLRTVIMESPKIPKDEGTLQASASAHVNGKPVATSAAYGHSTPKAQPVTGAIQETIPRWTAVITIGVNTPYAARLHEHPEYDFNEAPMRGAGYVTKALARTDAIMRAMAKDVARELES